MPTVTTTATPYCTPTRLLDYVDWNIVADALLDDSDAPHPVRATIIDSTSDLGARLTRLCLAASGEVESACLARELYLAADLAALTGATAAHLEQVCAGLTIMRLFSRRMPSAGRPEDIPAVRAAMDALAMLGDGKRIFGLIGQAAAGAGSTPITVEDSITAGTRYTVTQASRFFGNRDRSARYGRL